MVLHGVSHTHVLAFSEFVAFKNDFYLEINFLKVFFQGRIYYFVFYKSVTMDFESFVQSPQLDDDIVRFEAGTKHGTKALMVMDDLRRRQQLSDVAICVGKRKICAHKLVLASFSSYFLAMFTGGMIESSQDEVTLKDIDEKAVEALIDFAYTGKLDITTDCVQPLLYASSLFQLTAIQKACSDFLSRQLHPSNCLGIKSFADAHSCTELLLASEKYIKEHFVDVVKNEEFLLLPYEDLASMLASEELNVESEEDVYNSLITWARYDLEERQGFLADLLEKIRLPLLSATFLINQVEKEELIRQDIACRNLLDEAKNFHLLPERRLNATKSKCPQFCPRKSTLGILYSVGGMDSTGHSVRTVERYDFYSGKVRLVCPTNTPRSGVGLAVVDKNLYAVGGHDGTTYLNSVEYYDPKFKQWKFVASMAAARRYVAVGVLNGLLYAVGGYDGTSVMDTVEVYDPRIDQWKYLASMKSRRRHAAVGVLTCKRPGTTASSGYLFVVGGHDGINYLKSAECYSPHTNEWTQVASMNARRGGVAVGCIGGHLYATGGYNDTTNLNTTERYYPEEDRWSFVAPMSVGRSGHAVGVVGEYLYALGGHDGISYRNTVEYFNPMAGEWKSIGPMGTCKAVAGVTVVKESKVHKDTVT